MSWLVPEDLGIPLGVDQDRVPGILGPGSALVQAVGDALAAVVVTRPEGDQRRRAAGGREAGGIRLIQDRAARLHAGAETLILPERRLELGPVDQVAAHCVNPALVPALGEQVILAVQVDEPVGVIQPAFLTHSGVELMVGPLAGGEMELWAELLPVEVRAWRQQGGLSRSRQLLRGDRACGEHRQHQRDAHAG